MTEAAPPAPAPARWNAVAALMFGACVIGLSPILVRLADTGAAAAGFWRLAFALPLLALMTRRSEGAIGAPPRIALWAGVFFALDLGFWHYGIRYTSVANATVLSNLTPVVVTLFAWIFLKQRPRALFVAAVVAAVAGASMMAVAKGGGQLKNQPLGDTLSAITSLWYALYFLALSEGRKAHGASRLMLWASAVGAPLLLIAALAFGEPVLPVSAQGWAVCAGLGLMHVVGQGAIAWAIGRLPAATASVGVLVQVVVSAYLGWLLFAEPVGALQAMGAAVTLGGVVLAQWSSRARPT